MPLLDFTEIPEANKATGHQDSFELFTRDFLEHLGFEILSGPDRGADGGRDLIVRELRPGLTGTSEVCWLVSCKHKAHSGHSVGLADEQDILDRIKRHDCQGVLAVYSTLPAAALSQKLESLTKKAHIQHSIYDRERLENLLLSSAQGRVLAARYFPLSYSGWTAQNPKPARLLSPTEKLRCGACQKDLLDPPNGIIVLWKTIRALDSPESAPPRYERVYWSCKGECDRKLKALLAPNNAVDAWEDIPDVCIPSVYLKWSMSIMNELRAGWTFSDEAFDALKEFMILTFPHAARDLTDDERERFKALASIPAHLGGFA